jgi:hypothetical protein
MMNHFEFRTVPAGEWRRIKGTTARGTEGDRPHFVPVTDDGQRFAALDAFGACGSIGLCPGEILVDGEWVTGYRFIKIPEAAAVEMVAHLNEAVNKFLQAT